jgi:hypothetical protein
MEFKVMDMCSILGCTWLVFKTQRLSEEAITDPIFLSLKKCCQCGDETELTIQQNFKIVYHTGNTK